MLSRAPSVFPDFGGPWVDGIGGAACLYSPSVRLGTSCSRSVLLVYLFIVFRRSVLHTVIHIGAANKYLLNKQLNYFYL